MEKHSTGRGAVPTRTPVRLTAFAFLIALACVLQTHSASAQAAPERVRIPTSFANVHMGPSTGQQVLVLVPRGTVLEVIGRDKEWVQVRLTPDLRKTGMVLRWYRNEDQGWMHDSTVEPVKGETR
jgi:uncharacterized protein YgiM (DUF1202 family)